MTSAVLAQRGWLPNDDGSGFHQTVRFELKSCPDVAGGCFDVEDVAIDRHGIPVSYIHTVGGEIRETFEVRELEIR